MSAGRLWGRLRQEDHGLHAFLGHQVEISDKDTDWKSAPAPSRSLSEDEMRAAQRAEAQSAVANMIFFAFDSFELTPESRDVLTAKADALKKYSLFSIVIEGHCDERGTSEYNLALGERRAKAAAVPEPAGHRRQPRHHRELRQGASPGAGQGRGRLVQEPPRRVQDPELVSSTSTVRTAVAFGAAAVLFGRRRIFGAGAARGQGRDAVQGACEGRDGHQGTGRGRAGIAASLAEGPV